MVSLIKGTLFALPFKFAFEQATRYQKTLNPDCAIYLGNILILSGNCTLIGGTSYKQNLSDNI